MPLRKNGSTTAEPTAGAVPAQQTPAAAQPETPKAIGGAHKAGDRAASPMTKDDYWRRREERDVQRDKDMAWSGLAQAALESPYVCQFNTANNVDGLVDLVAQVVEKLLAKRNTANKE